MLEALPNNKPTTTLGTYIIIVLVISFDCNSKEYSQENMKYFGKQNCDFSNYGILRRNMFHAI